MVVSCKTVNLVLYGKQCWSDSSRSYKLRVRAEVAHQPHKLKVNSSNLLPATNKSGSCSSKEEHLTVNQEIGYRDSMDP